MEAWFISDVHVKDLRERNGQNLLRFLHFLETRVEELGPQQLSLYLLGDIFDLWIADHQVFVDKYKEVIEILQRLKSKTIKIVFIEGNHDVHIDRFFRDVLGFEVHVEAQIVYEQGLRIRIEHGDLINLQDRAYQRYRSFIRSFALRWLAHVLPGRIWLRIGERASQTSRKFSAEARNEQEGLLRNMIRQHAEKLAKDQNIDVVISGHMHVKDDVELTVGNHRIRSINLGSWLDGETPALCLRDQKFSWYFET